MPDKTSAKLNLGSAITPLDGRYYPKINNLSNFFSEKALNKYRISIEIKYLIKLSESKIIRSLSSKEKKILIKLYSNYNEKDFNEIKKVEKEINHDVKAVEYFLRKKISQSTLKDLSFFIHFGLTSEDINNLAYSLMLKECKENILESELTKLINQLKILAVKYKTTPLLARTHGQPAVPTTIGKEIANYVYRLKKQLIRIKDFRFEGKCNGAVGGNNALKTAIPQVNWIKFSKKFVESLGLINNPYTTQILFYDNWIEFFQIIYLINAILIDLSINLWTYIMLNVFLQKKKENEVGSSTMPQKINPINFEQAEGSLGIANSFFEFFERKLVVSRLQRDLSDSIVRRSFAEAVGYTILGWQNIQIGLNKINVNKTYLKKELNQHWETLTEAIQTVLRLKKNDKAYEKVKKIVRGKTINKSQYLTLLKHLGLDNDKKLKDLTPEKYLGYAKELAESV